MRPRLFTLAVVTVFLFAACSSSSSPSPSGGASSPAASGPAGSAAPSGSAAAGGWDPAAITGTAVLSGWRSSPEEGEALTQTLLGFPAVYPNVHGRLPADRRRLPDRDDRPRSAATSVPDLFYVDAEYAPEWIDQGFLEPLDDYIAKSGMRHEHSSSTATCRPSRARTGRSTVCPRTATPSAMAYNSDRRDRGPDDDGRAGHGGQALKGKNDLKAPICLNPGLDRGARVPVCAGRRSLVNADGTASAIDTEASKAAVQWYLDLFKDGLGMTARRPRLRVVRRGSRQEAGRDDLRGRLARSRP